MNRINLLPSAERPLVWSLWRLFFLPFLALLLLYGTITCYYYFTVLSCKQKLLAVQQNKELLQPAQLKMQEALLLKQELLGRRQAAVQLSCQRHTCQELVAGLGYLTGQQLWLTEVTMADTGVVLVKGRAASYPELISFVQRMAASEIFSEPALTKAEKDIEQGYTHFEIIVKYCGK